MRIFQKILITCLILLPISFAHAGPMDNQKVHKKSHDKKSAKKKAGKKKTAGKKQKKAEKKKKKKQAAKKPVVQEEAPKADPSVKQELEPTNTDPIEADDPNSPELPEAKATE